MPQQHLLREEPNPDRGRLLPHLGQGPETQLQNHGLLEADKVADVLEDA